MAGALEKLRELRASRGGDEQSGFENEAPEPLALTEYTELPFAPPPAFDTELPFAPPPAFDPAASAALQCVACSEKPLPHPQIVRALAEQGYSKPEAYNAVAYCQGRGWIEHNLTTGYVLCGDPSSNGRLTATETTR